MELIDKAALVAELKKRIKYYQAKNQKWGVAGYAGRVAEDEEILNYINTLEVKEVDLDKSLTDFMTRYAYENGGEYPSAIDIAKHFFKLGRQKVIKHRKENNYGHKENIG